MCQFFSLNSNGKGNPFYFDAELRKKCLEDKLNYSPDSHTSIADYYGFKNKKEDKLNKYEYNPLTKQFKIDQLNTTDDSKQIKKFCKELDFKIIVPELIIKPIIHPFKIRNRKRITEKDLQLLKNWVSVRNSVRVSVWDSVRNSVWVSLWVSVRDSVWASVGASVEDSVRASVGDSVRASVGVSLWDSVRGSVGGYTSSFFNIKYKHDYSCIIKLWESGLVPSFDDKLWRLHGGKNGKILWEGKI